MKLKNIATGDFVQVKKSLCHSEFKAKQVCEVIDVDHADKHGFDVLIQGKNCLDWVNHKDLKKPGLKLKQLDQSIFDGLDEKWRFAMVSSVGIPFVYDYKPTGKRVMFSDDATQQKIKAGKVMRIDEHGYDASNWQNSLIERDTAKDSAEVDLSSELTGNDLCRAMLARGDTRVMCEVYDDHNRNYLTHVIREYYDEKFHTQTNRWSHAIPISSRGNPLTASEAGL